MIIGIFGNLSSGKTLTAYYLIDRLGKGKEVITNSTNKRGYIVVDLDYLIVKAKSNPELFYNKILFLDEAHTIVDARRSSSSLNTDYTMFLTQLGKLDCILIYTSQILSSQIDLRLRELTDYYLFCSKINQYGGSVVSHSRILNYQVYIKVKGFVKLMGGLKFKKLNFVFNPNYLFNQYDTRQILMLDRDKYKK